MDLGEILLRDEELALSEITDPRYSPQSKE